MAYLDKITVSGTTYDIQDTKAQADIVDLKSAIGELTDYGAEVTTDKYINYQTGGQSTLSGAKYITVKVCKGMKVYYDSTIGSADLRGLAFYNENGTFVSGYQMIATTQVIDVPETAVLMKATVTNDKDIVLSLINVAFDEFSKAVNEQVDNISEDIYGDPTVDVLSGQIGYSDGTSGGITYTKNSSGTEITASGTRSGTSFRNILASSSAIPTGFTKGSSYNVKVESTSNNLYVGVLWYINGENTGMVNILEDTTITIPNDITGMVIRFIVGNGWPANSSATITMPKFYTISADRGLTGKVDDLEKAVFGTNPSSPIAVVKHDAGLLSAFHTVGCIGDSLSSGECAYKTSGTVHYIDLYDFSWGQCLARSTGNTYYNFSKGGLTTKTWMETENGDGFGPDSIHAFDGNHDCDAYFIGLGQNDKNVSMTVGTASDIGTSAETYYRYYGDIITAIQTNTPKAPIFCFTDPCPVNGDLAYNAAVREIVTLFSNVYLIDLYTYAYDLYNTGYIGQQKRSGHFNAVGYQEMAYVISTYVDSIVRGNVSAFQQIEFIGTDYAWTD